MAAKTKVDDLAIRSKAIVGLDEMYDLAPAAKAEIDDLAGDIASRFDGGRGRDRAAEGARPRAGEGHRGLRRRRGAPQGLGAQTRSWVDGDDIADVVSRPSRAGVRT